MAEPLDRLFDLLPAYYRSLDAAPLGPGPLQSLLRLIAGQAAAIEADVARLYDDQFIETCQPWVAPYIGDLVGYQAVEGGTGGPAALSPRADVANTIAVRRRKGTLAVLEQLSRDVADWPAVAVELATLVGEFVPVRFAAIPLRWRWKRSPRGGLLDLRDPALAQSLGTPFDRLARTADVRRVSAVPHPGRASVSGVAVFAYRLQSVPAGPSPAYPARPRGFTFDPVGRDVPLFTRPDPPPAASLDVPAPIRLGMLPSPGADPSAGGPDPADYYGKGRSFVVYFPDPDDTLFPAVPKEFGDWKVFPAGQFFGASLDQWETKPDTFPPSGTVAVDPERGRLMLAADLATALGQRRLYVAYHYGTPDTLGAGGQPWEPLATEAAMAPPVADGPALVDTIANQWHPRHPGQAPPQDLPPGDAWKYSPSLLVELGSSDVFEIGDTEWTVPAGCTLHVRAGRVIADGGERTACPQLRPEGKGKGLLTVRLAPGRPGDAPGGPVPGGRLVLEGLLFAGLELGIGLAAGSGPSDFLPAGVLLHQVTLLPPAPPTHPCLRVEGVPLRLRAERCILGPITLSRGALAGAPVSVELTDSILDAGDADSFALADPTGCHAPATLTAHGVTVQGRVEVHALDLAENSLFLGRLHVARRQRGCVRYCYVAGGSRTPRRYQCQPDPPAAPVRPVFTSTRSGNGGYFQLAASAPAAITAGADDQGEMGAYHRLQQGQRAARLQARLAEFTPTGFDVALFFVT
jgi:hypothetical protein